MPCSPRGDDRTSPPRRGQAGTVSGPGRSGSEPVVDLLHALWGVVRRLSVHVVLVIRRATGVRCWGSPLSWLQNSLSSTANGAALADIGAGDKQLGGGLVADAVDGDQWRAGAFDQRPQPGFQVGDLGCQRLVAAGQAAQGQPDRDMGLGWVAGDAKTCAGLHELRPARVRAADPVARTAR